MAKRRKRVRLGSSAAEHGARAENAAIRAREIAANVIYSADKKDCRVAHGLSVMLQRQVGRAQAEHEAIGRSYTPDGGVVRNARQAFWLNCVRDT